MGDDGGAWSVAAQQLLDAVARVNKQVPKQADGNLWFAFKTSVAPSPAYVSCTLHQLCASNGDGLLVQSFNYDKQRYIKSCISDELLPATAWAKSFTRNCSTHAIVSPLAVCCYISETFALDDAVDLVRTLFDRAFSFAVMRNSLQVDIPALNGDRSPGTYFARSVLSSVYRNGVLVVLRLLANVVFRFRRIHRLENTEGTLQLGQLDALLQHIAADIQDNVVDLFDPGSELNARWIAQYRVHATMHRGRCMIEQALTQQFEGDARAPTLETMRRRYEAYNTPRVDVEMETTSMNTSSCDVRAFVDHHTVKLRTAVSAGHVIQCTNTVRTELPHLYYRIENAPGILERKILPQDVHPLHFAQESHFLGLRTRFVRAPNVALMPNGDFIALRDIRADEPAFLYRPHNRFWAASSTNILYATLHWFKAPAQADLYGIYARRVKETGGGSVNSATFCSSEGTDKTPVPFDVGFKKRFNAPTYRDFLYTELPPLPAQVENFDVNDQAVYLFARYYLCAFFGIHLQYHPSNLTQYHWMENYPMFHPPPYFADVYTDADGRAETNDQLEAFATAGHRRNVQLLSTIAISEPLADTRWNDIHRVRRAAAWALVGWMQWFASRTSDYSAPLFAFRSHLLVTDVCRFIVNKKFAYANETEMTGVESLRRAWPRGENLNQLQSELQAVRTWSTQWREVNDVVVDRFARYAGHSYQTTYLASTPLIASVCATLLSAANIRSIEEMTTFMDGLMHRTPAGGQTNMYMQRLMVFVMHSMVAATRPRECKDARAALSRAVHSLSPMAGCDMLVAGGVDDIDHTVGDYINSVDVLFAERLQRMTITPALGTSCIAETGVHRDTYVQLRLPLLRPWLYTTTGSPVKYFANLTCVCPVNTLGDDGARAYPTKHMNVCDKFVCRCGGLDEVVFVVKPWDETRKWIYRTSDPIRKSKAQKEAKAARDAQVTPGLPIDEPQTAIVEWSTPRANANINIATAHAFCVARLNNLPVQTTAADVSGVPSPAEPVAVPGARKTRKKRAPVVPEDASPGPAPSDSPVPSPAATQIDAEPVAMQVDAPVAGKKRKKPAATASPVVSQTATQADTAPVAVHTESRKRSQPDEAATSAMQKRATADIALHVKVHTRITLQDVSTFLGDPTTGRVHDLLRAHGIRWASVCVHPLSAYLGALDPDIGETVFLEQIVHGDYPSELTFDPARVVSVYRWMHPLGRSSPIAPLQNEEARLHVLHILASIARGSICQDTGLFEGDEALSFVRPTFKQYPMKSVFTDDYMLKINEWNTLLEQPTPSPVDLLRLKLYYQGKVETAFEHSQLSAFGVLCAHEVIRCARVYSVNGATLTDVARRLRAERDSKLRLELLCFAFKHWCATDEMAYNKFPDMADTLCDALDVVARREHITNVSTLTLDKELVRAASQGMLGVLLQIVCLVAEWQTLPQRNNIFHWAANAYRHWKLLESSCTWVRLPSAWNLYHSVQLRTWTGAASDAHCTWLDARTSNARVVSHGYVLCGRVMRTAALDVALSPMQCADLLYSHDASMLMCVDVVPPTHDTEPDRTVTSDLWSVIAHMALRPGLRNADADAEKRLASRFDHLLKACGVDVQSAEDVMRRLVRVIGCTAQLCSAVDVFSAFCPVPGCNLVHARAFAVMCNPAKGTNAGRLSSTEAVLTRSLHRSRADVTWVSAMTALAGDLLQAINNCAARLKSVHATSFAEVASPEKLVDVYAKLFTGAFVQEYLARIGPNASELFKKVDEQVKQHLKAERPLPSPPYRETLRFTLASAAWLDATGASFWLHLVACFVFVEVAKDRMNGALLLGQPYTISAKKRMADALWYRLQRDDAHSYQVLRQDVASAKAFADAWSSV